MISVNHPGGLGAALSDVTRRDPILYRIMQPSPIRSFAAPQPAVPVNQISPEPPAEQLPVEIQTGVSASSSAPASGALPIQVSSIVDPVTGVTYAGYLTPDAQALYQSGSLLTGGNHLTPQGSALAAQGDLIQGTPAPSAAQIAQAQPTAAASTSSWMDWLSEETIFSGYPNGLIAAGGVIALAWMFGGKKRRR